MFINKQNINREHRLGLQFYFETISRKEQEQTFI